MAPEADLLHRGAREVNPPINFDRREVADLPLLGLLRPNRLGAFPLVFYEELSLRGLYFRVTPNDERDWVVTPSSTDTNGRFLRQGLMGRVLNGGPGFQLKVRYDLGDNQVDLVTRTPTLRTLGLVKDRPVFGKMFKLFGKKVIPVTQKELPVFTLTSEGIALIPAIAKGGVLIVAKEDFKDALNVRALSDFLSEI